MSVMPNLDLTSAPRVIYLFGLVGAGKNWVGDIMAKLSQRSIYHADQDVTHEMQQAANEGRSFTDEMRDRFFEIVSASITDRLQTVPSLIVTQGTYKRRHRDFLARQISGIDFLQIVAPEHLITERLKKRGGAFTLEYAQRIQHNFEPPPPGVKTLVNDGDELRVVAQLQELYGL